MADSNTISREEMSRSGGGEVEMWVGSGQMIGRSSEEQEGGGRSAFDVGSGTSGECSWAVERTDGGDEVGGYSEQSAVEYAPRFHAFG